MLHENLEAAWQARRREMPLSPVLQFAPEGLLLGAGTVIVAAEDTRQLESLRGREAHVLALLSAAYGKAVPPSVLGNIKRAAKAWREGDDCLAYIHLAHARLRVPNDAYGAAYRLFIVDGFMKTGASPRVVFEALRLSPRYVEAVEKAFNPDEPRVPAGSGRTSGQWTRGSDGGGQTVTGPDSRSQSGHALAFEGPLPAARSVLSRIGSAAASASLGDFASAVLLRAGGAATAVFGLLFIPSPNRIDVEGDVPEIPGLHYYWKRDEILLRLTYANPDGSRQRFTAELQEDVFHDAQGRVVGRLLSNGSVVIDPAAIFPQAANDDQPKLCPMPGPDNRTNNKGADYEAYVKSIVNPENPTPVYWGFRLPNRDPNGSLVHYDDCEHSTGTMIDAKDKYAGLLTFPQGLQSVAEQFADEAKRQVDAAGARGVRWYFSEEQTAEFARTLFEGFREGREKIDVVFLPWPGGKK